MTIVLTGALDGTRRVVSIERDALREAAREAGDVGALTAQEQVVLQAIEADALSLAPGDLTALRTTLRRYDGPRVELAVTFSRLAAERAGGTGDDLLAALRHPRLWLRYPADPRRWRERLGVAAASLGLRVYDWRDGVGFEPGLPGAADTRTAAQALDAALAVLPRLPDRTLLLLRDLDVRDPVESALHTNPIRGRVQRLCDELARLHRPVQLTLLQTYDDVPPQLEGYFEVVRLSAPRRETPVLDRLGRDLVALARGGELTPVIGNETELERLLVTLSIMPGLPNNVLLVGEPGVGKTALVEELARRIAVGAVPAPLRGLRLIHLRANDLIAGQGTVGALESRLRDIVDEVTRNRGRVALFIDEAHTLFDAGGQGSPLVQALKEGWARGDLPTIAATTLAEAARLEADAAVESRFRRVPVPRPTDDQVLAILRAMAPRLADHHGITIAEDALLAARDGAACYLDYQAPPRAPLRLLGLAASSAAMNGRHTVTAADVNSQLEAMIGVRISPPDATELRSLRELEGHLAEQLRGQDRAVAEAARLIRGRRLGRRPRGADRPLTLLVLGPSGVGKTELARLLQHEVCNPTLSPILWPMEQFGQDFQVSRLIGSPPGYVGHERGAELAERIQGRPHSVVVFDEIEKAHPEVARALLQILETGRFVDPRGRIGDYRHTIIVLTSNILEDVALDGLDQGDLRRIVVQAFSRPGPSGQAVGSAFVGRVQRIVPFRSLTVDACAEIAAGGLARLADTLATDYGLMGYVADGAAGRLATARFDPAQNARPIVAAVEEVEAVARDRLELDEAGTTAQRVVLDWIEREPHVEVTA